MSGPCPLRLPETAAVEPAPPRIPPGHASDSGPSSRPRRACARLRWKHRSYRTRTLP